MEKKDINNLIEAMKPVFATKEDLEVFPTAEMMNKSFKTITAQLDRIENTILATQEQRIVKLEKKVKELADALAL